MGFLDDVMEQPEVLIRIFEKYNSELKDRLEFAASQMKNQSLTVAFGMGSSYYAAELLALRLSSRGRLAFAMDASELFHYRRPLLNNHPVLVGISQSGESAETCLVAENRPQGVQLISITNKEDSRLAKASDVLLPLFAGEETGTSSKTYIATLAILNIIADAVTGDTQLSPTSVQACAEIMRKVSDTMANEGEKLLACFGDFKSIIYVGRGPGLITALQSALITKEIAQVHAESMSAGQFRHGPLELAGPDLLVVVFAPSGPTVNLLVKLSEETAEFGSPTWLITDTVINTPQRPNLFISRLPTVEEYLSPLVSIIAPEFLAATMAKRKGRVPGEFTHISKVTRYE